MHSITHSLLSHDVRMI